MLTDAEVVEHACRQRLVRVARERRAVEHHTARREDSARQRDWRPVQRHDVDRVGSEVPRDRAGHVKTDRAGVRALADEDRDVDIAPRPQVAKSRAAE